MSNQPINLKKTAEHILDKLKNEKIDQAEVYLQKSGSFHLDILNQEIESINQVDEIGLAIRVIKNNSLGFAFTSDLDDYVVKETIQKALQNAKNNTPDEFNDLPSPASTQKEVSDSAKVLQLFDQDIESIGTEEKIRLAKEIEKSAYAVSDQIKKTEKVTFANSRGELIILNSKGIDVSFESNQVTGMAQMIAMKNDLMEYGFSFTSSSDWKQFSPAEIGIKSAKQALALLGGQPMKSGKYPIVMSPEIGTEILSILAGPLKAEAVLKQKSLFAGKINQVIASSKLNIIDNGRMPKHLGSSPFDAEGVPTQETMLISNGKLEHYLFNHYSARKMGNKSNTFRSSGNASRGDYHTTPGISGTNFYIPNGKTSPEAIIKNVKSGLYLMRLMGLHTANPVSGEFSLGAQGILIENGEKTSPVAGITISGNLLDILKGLEEIGNDLEFFPGGANYGSPTLMIRELSISGS